MIVDKWSNDWHNRISHGGPRLFPESAGCMLTFCQKPFMGETEGLIQLFLQVAVLQLSVGSWCSVSLRFHLFVLDVNEVDEEVGWVQDFLAWPQGWKDIPQIFRELLKIEDMLWKWGVEGVLGL